MSDDRRLKAYVRVMIDIDADSVLGRNTTWDNVEQATDAVRNLLTSGNKLALEALPQHIRSVETVWRLE